jgi:MtrB/PioB family decaheme-associated outer membrane protein
MRIHRLTWACVGAGLLLGGSAIGLAQDAPKGSVSVAAELGARGFTRGIDSLALVKFQEYRDLRGSKSTAPTVQQLLLKYTPGDSSGFYSITARRLFYRDQSVWLLAKRPGTYDFQVRWDRVPHIYSTTARSPGVETTPGFNTLPTPRPDSTAWRNAPFIGVVQQQWDPVKVSLGLTPSEKLDFKTDFTRIAKSGGIPASLSFSGSSGPQREFVSPIDQTMNDFHVSQSYTSSPVVAGSFLRSWQVMGSYGYSRFHNGITSTMVDNPQQALNTFSAGAATSRLSLAPNNAAQSASMVAAALFPLRTRVTGTVSGSWMRQNDPFFPQTNNDSLARDPNFALTALQRGSLEGRTRNTTVNLSATTHPFDRLTLAGRYRNFDYSNQTPPFRIKALIVSDRTVTVSDSAAAIPLPFTKANSDFSASYQLARALTFTAAYAIEDWKRDDQAGAGLPYDGNASVRNNVAKTSEKTPRVSLDFATLEWLSIHASYLSGRRRGDSKYIEASTEIIGFRRFDIADRDRRRANVMVSLLPVDAVTVELTFQTGDDRYPASQYGTQSDKSRMGGIDVMWNPADRLTASAGYTHEDAKNILNSRFRTGAAGSVTFDNPTYKWTNTNVDKNTTAYASLTANLIPEKLDLIGSASLMDGRYRVLNSNPVAPSGGTATNVLNATAEDWPEIATKLIPVALALRYRYAADWALTLRYQYEKYDQTDFHTSAPVFTSNGLASGTPITSFTGDLPGTIGQVAGSNTGQYHFLGNNYYPYNTGWVTILISYYPSLMPFARGRPAL